MIWLALGSTAAGLVSVLFLLWRMAVIRSERDRERARAVAAENALQDVRTVLGEEIRRLEAQVIVVTTQFKALSATAEAAARANPASIPEYLHSMLRLASTANPSVEGMSNRATAEIATSGSRLPK